MIKVPLLAGEGVDLNSRTGVVRDRGATGMSLGVSDPGLGTVGGCCPSHFPIRPGEDEST